MGRRGQLAAAAVTLLAVGGCSGEVSIGGRSLDQQDVEMQIFDGLTEFAGVEPAGVNCDGIGDLDVEEGATFQCTGTAPAGDEFTINLTLTDDDGGFRYEVPE